MREHLRGGERLGAMGERLCDLRRRDVSCLFPKTRPLARSVDRLRLSRANTERRFGLKHECLYRHESRCGEEVIYLPGLRSGLLNTLRSRRGLREDFRDGEARLGLLMSRRSSKTTYIRHPKTSEMHGTFLCRF